MIDSDSNILIVPQQNWDTRILFTFHQEKATRITSTQIIFQILTVKEMGASIYPT